MHSLEAASVVCEKQEVTSSTVRSAHCRIGRMNAISRVSDRTFGYASESATQVPQKVLSQPKEPNATHTRARTRNSACQVREACIEMVMPAADKSDWQAGARPESLPSRTVPGAGLRSLTLGVPRLSSSSLFTKTKEKKFDLRRTVAEGQGSMAAGGKELSRWKAAG